MGEPTGREENEAEQNLKQAGKFAGNLVKNSAPVKAIKAAIIGALPTIFLVIFCAAAGTVMLIGVVNMALAVKEGFIKNVWSKFAQISNYDEPRLQAWNDGGDPDQTALIFQQMKDVENSGEPLVLEKDGSNDSIDSLSYNSMWRDVMRNEQPMFAQEDMLYILQRAYDKNNEMFRMKNTHYTYEQWELQEVPATPKPYFLLVKNSNRGTSTSNADEIYDNLTREHIEGEEDEEGDKKFASHWQDAYALTYLYNIENMDNWGQSESSKYDPRDHGIEGKEALDINDPDDYYITDTDLQMVCDLFEYNFTYYWDEILSTFDNYTFSGYKNGNYTTGYRYRRLEDPDDPEGTRYDNKEDFTRTQNLNNPYEYLSYPDHLAYNEHTLPFTQFTPESCPNTISNTIESYKYIYVPIYDDALSGGGASLVHLDEGGVTEYTPDPGNFKPPNGDYCVGRWHVVDPRDFIDTMSILCPWYKSRSEGEEGKKWIEKAGYDWVQEMIDHYNLYLELLPNTGEDSHTHSRMDYFQHIADLYKDKKIEVFYEGTEYEGMDEYRARLEDYLLHPPKDITIAFDIDGTLDETKSHTDPEKLRKGVVNAFKWMEQQGYKYVITTATKDLDTKKEWIQTEIISKMGSADGFKGVYYVPTRNRYNYCHSHRIDILVDDNPNTIGRAAEHMPVIEVHCSDWDFQPSGHNIYEIDDFTQFKDAVQKASEHLPEEEDYSDWTIEFNTICEFCNPVNKDKPCFYNYQQKPESEKYPFYSYGVTYHNKEEKHIPEESWGEGEEGETPPFDDDPGGGVLPDVPEGEVAGKVWIGAHGGKSVNGWFYIMDGADEALDEGYYYSESQIQAMLAYLEKRSGGAIDFTSAAADVYKWNQDTGADVAAMFAIIISEGGCTSRHGKQYWNFFDFTAKGSETTYDGSHPWWNAKADCGTVGKALTAAMTKILHNYWGKGQNTYYKMCFNGYGYPQNAEEAAARAGNFTHCYCPWWEDTGYVTTGYDSSYSWCNKNAQYRKQLQAM